MTLVSYSTAQLMHHDSHAHLVGWRKESEGWRNNSQKDHKPDPSWSERRPVSFLCLISISVAAGCMSYGLFGPRPLPSLSLALIRRLALLTGYDKRALANLARRSEWLTRSIRRLFCRSRGCFSSKMSPFRLAVSLINLIPLLRGAKTTLWSSPQPFIGLGSQSVSW